jgi:hypothetical protein
MDSSDQDTIVVNFHLAFLASMHSDFFHGWMNKGLFYRPYHSWETRLSKQEEEESGH